MIETATQMRHNLALAFDIGLEVPEFHLLRNKSEEEREQFTPAEWRIIDDVAFKRIKGFDVTCLMFWTREKFRFQTIVINDNKLLTGGQGMELDYNCVTVFAGKIELGTQLNRLKKELIEREPDFRGFITLDLTLTEHKIYYRHISFKVKEAYFYAIEALAGQSIGTILGALEADTPVEKPKGYGAALCLYEYPFNPVTNYPVENIVTHIDMYDMPIVTGRGDKIKEAWDNVYKTIPDDVTYYNVCYRTDGDKLARDTAHFLFKHKKLI